MIQLLARNWWAVELRGALTFVFGLLALFLPGITLGSMILVFGIYALAEGIVLIFMTFNRREAPHWWVTLLQGLAGIGAGIVTLAYPGVSAVALLVIIAAWAIVTGILEIAGAIILRKEIKGEWLLILSGILSLVFAYMLLANPAVGALTLVTLIGVYAVIFGILLMLLGARVHRLLEMKV